MEITFDDFVLQRLEDSSGTHTREGYSLNNS